MEKLINKETISETKSLVVKTEKLLIGFKVNSQPTLVKANDYLVQITQAEKKVIERERKILDPMNQAKKSVMDFFRPVKDRLAIIKSQLKSDMGRYMAELARIELQKKAEIEKKVTAGKMDIDKASDKLTKLEEKKEVVIFRTNKVVKIIDENKIPKSYFVLDMVKVRKAALAGLIGEKEGVKVEEEKVVIGKGR